MNTQEFCSMYIDYDASQEHRVVMHETVWEKGSMGVSVLRSDRLIGKPALVLCGPKIALDAFIADLEKADKKGEVGGLELPDLCDRLVKIAKGCGVEVYHRQNWPLTSATSIAMASLTIPDKMPSTVVVPTGLTPRAELLWKSVFRAYKDEILKLKSRGEMWEVLFEKFHEQCEKYGLHPYLPVTAIDTEELISQLGDSVSREYSAYNEFVESVRDLVAGTPTKETVIRKPGESVYIVIRREVPVANISHFNSILNRLDGRRYLVSNNSVVYRISNRGIIALGWAPGKLHWACTIGMTKKEYETLNGKELVKICKRNG